MQTQQFKTLGGDGQAGSRKWTVVAITVVAGAVFLIGGGAYAMRCTLLPGDASLCASPDSGSHPAGGRPARKEPLPPQSSHVPMPAGVETTGCEDSGAVPLDRLRICNRAHAMAMANAGAVAAAKGKLVEAEELYRAALAKDPDFYGTYLNYSALRVRQKEYADAIRLIDMSIEHGFNAPEYLEKDTVFDTLRNDRQWGRKLAERLAVIRRAGMATAAKD
jgi:tetratricopeptide (TPR) repeat protein